MGPDNNLGVGHLPDGHSVDDVLMERIQTFRELNFHPTHAKHSSAAHAKVGIMHNGLTIPRKYGGKELPLGPHIGLWLDGGDLLLHLNPPREAQVCYNLRVQSKSGRHTYYVPEILHFLAKGRYPFGPDERLTDVLRVPDVPCLVGVPECDKRCLPTTDAYRYHMFRKLNTCQREPYHVI